MLIWKQSGHTCSMFNSPHWVAFHKKEQWSDVWFLRTSWYKALATLKVKWLKENAHVSRTSSWCGTRMSQDRQYDFNNLLLKKTYKKLKAPEDTVWKNRFFPQDPFPPPPPEDFFLNPPLAICTSNTYYFVFYVALPVVRWRTRYQHLNFHTTMHSCAFNKMSVLFVV